MTRELTHDNAFVGYPRDYVLGIFERPGAAETAVSELIAAGFGESDLLVLSRPADAKKVDADGKAHGVATTVERTVEELGDKDTLDEYSKALKTGASVVGAHIGEKDQREQANLIMQNAGGQSIRYFGRFVVEDLDTAPNQPRP
ncbi:MAG: hypothetical protein EPO16_12300 [Dehalococcoidia bacterium]|nr:MAG: hypothetical protein EPO16_12300 [Dehalococcoidia bacterium]